MSTKNVGKESWLHLLIDSSRGVYIPQHFAELTAWDWPGAEEDRKVLLEGPENEDYWEVWADVLDNATATIEEDGEEKTYRLYHDWDLWAYREPEEEREREEYREFFGLEE